jgi:signal transduction histidine kinase/ActR/RegA family two-component response regulator
MRRAVDPAATPSKQPDSAGVFGQILRYVATAMRARAVVASLCLVAILPLGAIPGGFFDTSRNWLFDLYQRAAPAQRPAARTVIIDIDSASLERIGQWPWPRHQLARLVDAAGGARAVGIDILLAEPDRMSPAAWASTQPGLAPDTRRALEALPSSDAVLAASIAKAPVVLAALVEPARNRNWVPATPMTVLREAGGDARSALPAYAGLTPPLPELAAASRGIGDISAPVETDGVLRRMPAISKAGSVLVPSFAVELTRLASGPSPVVLESGEAGLQRIDIGDKAIPSDPQGRVWLRYAEPAPAPSVPAYRVLEGGVDPRLFRDRIVLIGASAPGLGAFVATPLRHSEAGVSVQAQMIETLLAGDALWRPPAAQLFELVLAFALGLSALILLDRLPGAVYAALLAGLTALMIAGSFAAFQISGLLIDWTFPAAMLAAVTLFAVAARLRREAVARRNSETTLAAALRQVEFAAQLEQQARQLESANTQLKDEAAARQRMEEQLVRAQRMEAIGHLTGGIAHDFNNLLTVVLGSLQLAVRRDMSADVRRLVQRATTASERCVRLTSDLLAFGRKQRLTVRAVDANALISGMLEMLGRTLTPVIQVRLALAPDLWPALADSTKLELALVNLVINARDALPDGGTVTIATRNVGPDDPGLPDDLRGAADDFVALSVSDDGVGMTEEVRQRAFEPFFTTKGTRQGSGLGLSMVYGLTKQLGGSVRLESQPGQGATISLFLPRASAASDALAPIVDETPRRAGGAPGRGGRVLLVDDDSTVRETVAAMLRELGNQVVEAEAGDAALAILDRGDPVDIMIADIVMPGLQGGALASEARRRRPDLPVLLITGYPGDAPERVAVGKTYAVLGKPFSPDELDAMIQSCKVELGSLKQPEQHL